MIILTGVMYPDGVPAGSYEVLHGTITNVGQVGEFDNYVAHLLQRPKAQAGMEGFEADVRVEGYNRSLGLAPLLGSILYHVSPLPLDFEPEVIVENRLTLKELDEFDARLRGQGR